ncbi:MAG: aldehyde dehydrogenase family protein, partial [Myxococcota bacterium]
TELGGGLYCPPTVLVDVDHRMKVMTEETFGPLMPLMPFSEPAEAIALANDSEYGLSGAVFAGDEAEALAIAAELEAGAISINDAGLTAVVHDAEKNAVKSSGLGPSRMGPAALRRFMRKRAYLIGRSPAATGDPWWF